MPVIVWTAPETYEGDDRLDVSVRVNEALYWAGERGGHRGIGRAFSPSVALGYVWVAARNAHGAPRPEELDLHRHSYVAELRESWRTKRSAWSKLLALPEVTLVSDLPLAWCHRPALVDVLSKLGADCRGERG